MWNRADAEVAIDLAQFRFLQMPKTAALVGEAASFFLELGELPLALQRGASQVLIDSSQLVPASSCPSELKIRRGLNDGSQ